MENVKQLIVKEVERIKKVLEGQRLFLTCVEADLTGCHKRIKAYEDELAAYKVVWDIIEKEENDIDINDIYEGKTNG